jgi:hypothetical protein
MNKEKQEREHGGEKEHSKDGEVRHENRSGHEHGWSKDEGYYVRRDYTPAPAGDEDIARYTRHLLKKGRKD